MPALLRFFDRAFGRYTLTSALATGSDFALATSLHTLGVSAGLATFLGCTLGGSIAFAVGRGWTFQAGSAPALPQLSRFLLVWGTSALLNSSGVPAVLRLVGSFPLVWVLVRGGVYLGWNYPLSRWFVFRGKPRVELSAL
ncbi:MAG TPA: GtrA family protein [Polyangiaceae bacterium]|nr:GtrA family protein [Polyangiaceae bacterium]